MTIIVYDPSTDAIFVDSKMTFMNGMAPITASKIMQKDGHKIAFSSGPIAGSYIVDRIMGVLASGEYHLRHNDQNLAGVGGFVRLSSGKVKQFHCDSSDLYISEPEKEFPFPVGSGDAWFSAFTAAGASVEKAIYDVARLHNQCGLPIETF